MNWNKAVIRTALLAVALGAMAPGDADAQVREKKQRTRITSADRKAAANARRAKVEEAKKLKGQQANGQKKGGSR